MSYFPHGPRTGHSFQISVDLTSQKNRTAFVAQKRAILIPKLPLFVNQGPPFLQREGVSCFLLASVPLGRLFPIERCSWHCAYFGVIAARRRKTAKKRREAKEKRQTGNTIAYGINLAGVKPPPPKKNPSPSRNPRSWIHHSLSPNPMRLKAFRETHMTLPSSHTFYFFEPDGLRTCHLTNPKRFSPLHFVGYWNVRTLSIIILVSVTRGVRRPLGSIGSDQFRRASWSALENHPHQNCNGGEKSACKHIPKQNALGITGK